MGIGRLPIYKQDGTLRTHFVYMLMCRDESGPTYIKFGFTKDIGKRLTQLRVGCPLPARIFATVEVYSHVKAKALETELHRVFADRRTSGEWFRFDIEADKAVFNDGWRGAFNKYLKPGTSWQKIEIARLDAHNKQHAAIMAKVTRKRRRKWAAGKPQEAELT
jgi:hypothetical protein